MQIAEPALVYFSMSRTSAGSRSGQAGGLSSTFTTEYELQLAVTSRRKTGEPVLSERSNATRVIR